MKTAISLIRVSKETQQHGHGLERQEDDVKLWLSRNPEFNLVHSIEARGESAYYGKHLEREFGRVLSEIEQGLRPAPDALLVAEFSRLSRLDYFTANALISRIINVIPELVICDTDSRYSKEKTLTTAKAVDLVMKIQLSHEESHNKSKHIRKAKAARVEPLRSGEKRVHQLPFWLHDTGTSYELLPDGVAAVQRIYELYVEGNGIVSIANKLNDEGYKLTTFRGASNWGKSTIERVLFQTPQVIGHHVVKVSYTPEQRRVNPDLPKFDRSKDITLENLFPAAIDTALYERVQTMFKLKKGIGKGRRSTTNTNVLRGLCSCTCGYVMAITTNRRKSSKTGEEVVYYYYKCTRKNGEGSRSSCNNKSSRYEAFIQKLLYTLLDDSLFVADVSLPQRLSDKRNELEVLEQTETTIMQRLLNPDLSKSMEKMLSDESLKVESQIESLRAEITDLELSKLNTADQRFTNLEKLDISTVEGRSNLHRALKQLLSKVEVNFTDDVCNVVLQSGKSYTFKPSEVDAGGLPEAYEAFMLRQASQENALSDFEFNK